MLFSKNRILMSDIFSKSRRSEIMANIPATNTKPEITIRKYLFKKGFRYRINYKKFVGKPDIVLPKHKAIIFIHGCFWHSHPNCKDAHLPKSNIDFWEKKISSNIKRDELNIKLLKEMGWNIIVIWECEIKKKNIDLLMEQVMNCILTHTHR